jgi:hypothetical protein
VRAALEGITMARYTISNYILDVLRIQNRRAELEFVKQQCMNTEFGQATYELYTREIGEIEFRMKRFEQREKYQPKR